MDMNGGIRACAACVHHIQRVPAREVRGKRLASEEAEEHSKQAVEQWS